MSARIIMLGRTTNKKVELEESDNTKRRRGGHRVNRRGSFTAVINTHFL